jgi:predicted secreted protein
MAATDGGWIGRDATIEIYIDTPSATEPVDGPLWLALGGTRGLSISGTWGSVDVTSRSSAGNFREKIADYLETSLSTDGVALRAAASNIKNVREYFHAPTTGQPCAWIRATFPEESGATYQMSYPVLLTSWGDEAPYDAEATFSLEAEGNGQPVFTDIAAP